MICFPRLFFHSQSYNKKPNSQNNLYYGIVNHPVTSKAEEKPSQVCRQVFIQRQISSIVRHLIAMLWRFTTLMGWLWIRVGVALHEIAPASSTPAFLNVSHTVAPVVSPDGEYSVTKISWSFRHKSPFKPDSASVELGLGGFNVHILCLWHNSWKVLTLNLWRIGFLQQLHFWDRQVLYQ